MTTSALALETDAPEQRRTLQVLFAAQVMSGAGLAAGITVGALLARDLTGSTAAAGIPAMLFTVGAAVSALAIGKLSQSKGRRWGLTWGYGLGAVGSAGVVLAAWAESLWGVWLALLIYGSGSAANLLARYAGADLAAPHRRGRAVAWVLVGTTGGAVAGPTLVDVSGRWVSDVMSAYAGPFVIAAVAYTVGALVLALMLRPDPLILARARALESTATPVAAGFPGMVRTGAAVMVIAQAVMIAIMAMTPIHMHHHGHHMSVIGVVIGAHVAAMYLPAPLSGVLVDRWGARTVAVASMVTFAVAGVVAAITPGHSSIGVLTALVVLGLAWSLGIVSGTAMVVAGTEVNVRAHTQGRVDFLIALAGAGGGAASGVVVAGAGFSALSMGGATVALMLIPVLLRHPTVGTRRPRTPLVWRGLTQ